MWLPAVWLLAGVVLIAAETLSGDFVLVMLGLAALAAAGTAALAGLGLSVGVFAALSVGLVVLARPALKSRFGVERELTTNAQALVGSRAVVESPVDHRDGRVRIRGDVWSARALDEQHRFETGRTVLVVEIQGATAVVSDALEGG